MRTIDLTTHDALRDVTRALVDRPPDYLVVTTGMGLRMWAGAAAGWGIEAELMGALANARIVARGAKAASAVQRAGLTVWWRAPHERMDEIVDRLTQEPLAGSRVALQLFDVRGHPATDALRAVAAEQVEVPVYQWRLPDDPRPAVELVQAAADGAVDAVTFTRQPAVHHLFRIAEDVGHDEALRRALNGAVMPACIGPVCAEAAREEGIERPVWPEPPRLPAMVRQVTERLARP
jgi:uroporphyrinogen-III synthase